MRDSARMTMEIGKEHFMKEADYKAAYEEYN
jgi:hypothetical protein